MSAVSVPNPLAGAAVIVLSSETQSEVHALSAEAEGVRAITTVDELRRADDIVARAVRLDAAIEAARKKAKAPVLELGQAIDEAASEARTGLMAIKATLGRMILDFQAAENARREAERRRMEEERRAAEEAARAAADAARAAAIAAAAAVPPDDDAPLPAPEPREVAAVVLPPERQMEAAPLRVRSVARRTVTRLVIVDLAHVPDEVAGVPLWRLDEDVALKLIKTGVQIPGLTTTTDAAVAAKGR